MTNSYGSDEGNGGARAEKLKNHVKGVVCRGEEAVNSRSEKLKSHLQGTLWLFLATATYLVALYLVKENPDWSPNARVALSLSPLVPGVVYLWRLWTAFATMDELQKRIQLEAWGIALTGTVVVSTTLNVLKANGLGFERYPHGLEIGGTYLTMFLLWCAGSVIANARYR